MARNDATTTINAPTVAGGDAMDETLATQSDGTTIAKRARVVLGDDAGRLLDFLLLNGVLVLPVYDPDAARDRDVMIQLLREIKDHLIRQTRK